MAQGSSSSAAASPPRSALLVEHQGLGAALTSFAGWDMPLRYGSDTAEHYAVRTGTGLFDLSHMGEIVVRGPEAAAALDFALVGALSAVAVDRARYTMLCASDGGVLDDLVVYRTGDTDFLVVANASNTALVFHELCERAHGFDAEVIDETRRWSLIGLQGPAAAGILAPLLHDPLDDLKYYASMRTMVAGLPALLARTGYTGEDGFEIFLTDGAVGLWRMLLDRGTSRGLLPAGLAARDSLRLEAGMPLYGNELGRDRTPFEAGLGRVVRLDKPGDFVGRAALSRRSAEPAQQVLVGLLGEGRRPARAHNVVLDGAGGPVGVITSGMPSPTLQRPIAMAYVDTASSTPGTTLVVDVRGNPEPMRVVDLPFYRRDQG